MTKTNGWQFASDGRGKLFTHSENGESTLHVSLSHTRRVVACAVALSGPIGIDVEAHAERDYGRIARYGFGRHEQARIEKEGAEGFYRVWTLREAIAKATGEGLALVTDTLDRVADGPEFGTWMTQCDGHQWMLQYGRPIPDLSLAIATVATPAGVHEIPEISAEDLVPRSGSC